MSAVNGESWYRAERCNIVKYFVERKKMDITQLSQVMLSEIKFESGMHPPTLDRYLCDSFKWVFFLQGPDL